MNNHANPLSSLVNDSPFICRKVYFEVEATVGKEMPEDCGYLHAHWHRENPTRMARDYEVLPKIEGRGRFLGACFSVLVKITNYILGRAFGVGFKSPIRPL